MSQSIECNREKSNHAIKSHALIESQYLSLVLDDWPAIKVCDTNIYDSESNTEIQT